MTLTIIEGLWIALGVYWLISAARLKQVKQTEGALAHWGRIALLVLLFEWVLSPYGRYWGLGTRFLPDTQFVAWLGAILTACGVALAAWARAVLGGNWSSAVTLKQGHELIARGPYRSIRHPIYSGILLGMIGTAVAVGEWRGLLAALALLLAHAWKARKEERLLAHEFGPLFLQHRSRTGMFLPRW